MKRWPKMKLAQLGMFLTLLKIVHLAYKMAYLVIIHMKRWPNMKLGQV